MTEPTHPQRAIELQRMAAHFADEARYFAERSHSLPRSRWSDAERSRELATGYQEAAARNYAMARMTFLCS